MEKKFSITYKFGLLIIISNILNLILTYCIPILRYESLMPTSLFISNLISVISVFPKGLPLMLFYTNVAISLHLFIYIAWQIIFIVCGIGIMKQVNCARIIFIFFSIIHISIFIFQILLTSLTRMNPSNDFGQVWGILFNLIYLLSGLLPIIYIIILTRPKIKELFINKKI